MRTHRVFWCKCWSTWPAHALAMPLMANGLTIIWALKDLTRNEAFWHQHKKGSSWIDAKSPWNFITKQSSCNAEKFRFNLFEFQQVILCFYSDMAPAGEKMGRRNSCAGSIRVFFGMCCYHECIQAAGCAPIFCNGGLLGKFCITSSEGKCKFCNKISGI